MSLENRTKRLEQLSRGGVLKMSDGTEIKHGPNELFDALVAETKGEEHRLLPYIKQTQGELGELFRALEGESDA